MFNRAFAEFIGTFWLVFGGCGSAILAAGAPDVGIGWLGVSLAFGLTVVTMAYAVGPISGGHFNPAVTLGLAVAGRFEPRDIAPYWAAQVLASFCAAGLLYLIVANQAGFEGVGGFASNGFGELSPMGYGMTAALIVEVLLTAIFVVVILGVTAPAGQPSLAPLAIGLTLVLIHLISIPVTNTSVNPARSTGVAFYAETAAVPQLWLFWVAPLVGAVLGAAIWRALDD